MSEKQSNKVWCNLFPNNKKILIKAKDEHPSGTMSGFLKLWFVVICRLIQAGISSEWIIANIDEVIEFCLKRKSGD